MARSSMYMLIAFLRKKVNDPDSSVWTDDELQNYLDMHRVHIRRERLQSDAEKKVYYSRFSMLEDDLHIFSGDNDSAVEIDPSKYTKNLIDGTFTFNEVQDTDLYLDAVSYDVHSAIAECLEQLATDPQKAIKWTRGGISYTHYDLMAMAKYHRTLAGPHETVVRRTYGRRI